MFLTLMQGTTHRIGKTCAARVVWAPPALAGRRRAGQRTRLSQAERTAIESHAVRVASDHLIRQGFTIRDVGATESYDLDARRTGERLFVEVKGTTSAGEQVILTKNEVDLNRSEHPHTMLVVVSRIHLDHAASPPRASGGVLEVTHPWLVAETALEPISYRYTR
ncbi:DUF3883 domain-containing protein [Actinokineospora sp. NBRC 105648]|uniref:protein NO VEIN domain-containing protein n=1 Tax=Actinokineospora sp. NBRC 105648 TaxID=3032206 RepID=UPI0024A05E2A|nr:DUF3883 domain-containing protein [Actinokineospora sp. NBRC 105648]GLZ37642.1 hypothetical protein Acsp05_12670 [Actinokineospora sp. NBRC 105648]